MCISIYVCIELTLVSTPRFAAPHTVRRCRPRHLHGRRDPSLRRLPPHDIYMYIYMYTYIDTTHPFSSPRSASYSAPRPPSVSTWPARSPPFRPPSARCSLPAHSAVSCWRCARPPLSTTGWLRRWRGSSHFDIPSSESRYAYLSLSLYLYI